MYMKQSHPIIQQYNYFQDTFGMYGGLEGNLNSKQNIVYSKNIAHTMATWMEPYTLYI